MATVTRQNLVIPEVLADAVAGAWPNRIALYGSQAVVESRTLPGGTKGGDKVKVPYFGIIGEFEIVEEGQPLEPTPLSMTYEEAVVKRAGKAFEATTLARLAAQYADLYGEVTRQILEGAARVFDWALIQAAAADGPGQLTVDRSNSTINSDVIADALQAWGDESRDAVTVVMHSKVVGDLRKLKDNEGRPYYEIGENGLPKINNLPIVVSDRVPVIPGDPPKYMTFFLRRGALALWYNGVPTVEVDRDILRDTEIMAVNVYFVAHRYSRLPGSSRPGVVRLITQ